MEESADFHKQATQPFLHSPASLRRKLPKKVGPYKIQSLLGKGGMSLLYLGLSPEGKPVAVKVLVPQYAQHQEMGERFLKEASILEATHHPNIVQRFSHGTWEHGYYLAMEFIQGVSLRQFIRQKSLTFHRALEIVLQVAYALCHLHTLGIVHRDLKPDNILITESGEVKVIDFGIAEWSEEGASPKEKKTLGTPVYMSPEQKENGESASFASDIYSLGVIAYELFVGKLRQGALHLSLLPAPVAEALKKALAPKVEDRYQDIVDFISDLTPLLTQELLSSPTEPKELVQILQAARSSLFPEELPLWPGALLGCSHAAGEKDATLYLDFFRFSTGRFAIVLAEPLSPTSLSFLPLLTLQGMLRMAFSQADPLEKQQVLEKLSQKWKEANGLPLALTLLLFSPDDDAVSLFSFGGKEIEHYRGGSIEPRKLGAPNPPFGEREFLNILKTTDPWSPGDTLILSSLHAKKRKSDPSWLRMAPQAHAKMLLTPGKDEQALLLLRRS